MANKPSPKPVRIDPALSAALVAMGERVNRTPEEFFRFVQEAVRRHRRDAKPFRSLDEQGHAVFLLLTRVVAIMFTEEPDALVIRGFGDTPTAEGDPVVIFSVADEGRSIH